MVFFLQIYHLNKYGDKLPSLPSSAAIIGNFDGVHLGHKQLLNIPYLLNYNSDFYQN